MKKGEKNHIPSVSQFTPAHNQVSCVELFCTLQNRFVFKQSYDFSVILLVTVVKKKIRWDIVSSWYECAVGGEHIIIPIIW